MTSSTVLPETFTRAVADLRAVRPRAEITVEEVPPPRRLAPFAYAVSATVLRQAEEVASGRLILLHDPDGHEAWGSGTLRLVTYVNAELEADLAADPLLPAVGWSWLVDALETHEAPYAALGGTVTQTTSTSFGELASRSSQPSGEVSRPAARSTADLELRASWTPLGGDLGAHMRAWCALLASTAGLPPPGVTALRAR
jgi:Protein of unknown function (DUF3000)